MIETRDVQDRLSRVSSAWTNYTFFCAGTPNNVSLHCYYIHWPLSEVYAWQSLLLPGTAACDLLRQDLCSDIGSAPTALRLVGPLPALLNDGHRSGISYEFKNVKVSTIGFSAFEKKSLYDNNTSQWYYLSTRIVCQELASLGIYNPIRQWSYVGTVFGYIPTWYCLCVA